VGSGYLNKKIANLGEEMKETSKSSRDKKFWKDLTGRYDYLLFTYEFWINKACEEFNKTQKEFVIEPKENVNYGLLRKRNCYWFQDPNSKLNNSFLDFCRKQADSKMWLVQDKINVGYIK
jgi:hypothetical protein